MVVATTEFIEAAEAQARALGTDPACVFIPHPVQDRTDDELRAMAERALGAAFDVRGFHDEILASGERQLGFEKFAPLRPHKEGKLVSDGVSSAFWLQHDRVGCHANADVGHPRFHGIGPDQHRKRTFNPFGSRI